MSLLVKGYSSDVVEEYEAALASVGFTHVSEETNVDLKKNGYHTYELEGKCIWFS